LTDGTTDHSISLTLYKLDEIVQGNLGQVVDPLMHEYQAIQLAKLSKDDRGLS
jgi:peptide chain release factor 1